MRISQIWTLFAEPFLFFSCSFSFRFFRLSYSHYFLLVISFLLAEKFLTLSLENPEEGTLINYRCIGLFKHRFCTKNGSCFSLMSSIRMQPIFKMNSPVVRSILALSATITKIHRPWTLSVTRRDQFSKGKAAGKPTLTNWLFLYYQLELEEQIFVLWSSLIHMNTSYPFYRKKRIFN